MLRNGTTSKGLLWQFEIYNTRQTKVNHFQGEHARSNVMGQLVKPGWGYSDRELERKARCSDRNLVREYHQGQQVYMPAQTGRI